MPTITVPDETYARIARRAEALGTTVEALVAPVLEQMVTTPKPNGPPAEPPVEMPYDEWKKGMEEWQARVLARAIDYPPGFECDVSRESIYEGCGE